MIRHFIHSGVFDPLREAHDVTFVFPEEENRSRRRINLNLDDLGIGAYRKLLPHPDRQPIWRKLFWTDVLRWRPGRDFAGRRKAYWNIVSAPRTLGIRGARKLQIAGLPLVYEWYKRAMRKRLSAMPHRALEALLDEERPDAMIHPTVLDGPFLNDLVEYGRLRKIPTILLMNSWDNPAGKRAIAATPDYLFVWGEQTKKHAVRLAGMPERAAVKFGVAQFEVYRNPPRLDRVEFCRRHGVSPDKRLLLFAGSSKGTNEYNHLQLLDQAADNGELGDTAVIYRPHPWGNCGDGGEHIQGHPWRHVVFEDSMRDYVRAISEGDKTATSPDYRNTVDVLKNVDAVISPLSTILLEAALNGKPPLCFLPMDEQNSIHFQSAVGLAHFEDVYRMDEFLVARGTPELIPRTVELLQRAADPNFAARLDKACRFFIEPFDQPYGQRLVDFIESEVFRMRASG